jgi:hypothetical protein
MNNGKKLKEMKQARKKTDEKYGKGQNICEYIAKRLPSFKTFKNLSVWLNQNACFNRNANKS